MVIRRRFISSGYYNQKVEFSFKGKYDVKLEDLLAFNLGLIVCKIVFNKIVSILM